MINNHHYRHNTATCFFFNKNIKIGILGGSFDPPHVGHIHISLIALKRLKLDKIWWLVTPQNRLKKNNIKNTFQNRLQKAREFTKNTKKITVLDIEYKNKLSSSYKTMRFIKKKTQKTKFVWIMGSDNLENFHQWLKPKLISKIFPVAVIERPSYSQNILNSFGAKILGNRLMSKRRLTKQKTPCWSYIKDKLNSLSSSKIRNSLNPTNL